MRLDQCLRALHPELSWTRIRNAIAKGQVTVDDIVERDAGRDITAQMRVELNVNRPAASTARLRLPRLYEDAHVLVIDKPAGLLSIPSHVMRKDTDDTVLGRVREYVYHRDGANAYAGMLHRLDRDTTGALAIALSREAHAAGRALFGTHDFDRRYLAIVHGVPAHERGTIEAPIASEYRSGRRGVVTDGRPALHAETHYTVRERFAQAALLELVLGTGRQHQIRAHLEYLGHPLLGEHVYTGGDVAIKDAQPARPMLHAWTLAFPHPITGARVSVEAEVPHDFEKVLAHLRRRSRSMKRARPDRQGD